MSRNIKKLVDLFLAWDLPSSVCSDQCATIQGYPNRIGTHLLTASEAEELFKYILESIPAPTDAEIERMIWDAAQNEAKPHYEHDESTWGAISSSSFENGARFGIELMRKHYEGK